MPPILPRRPLTRADLLARGYSDRLIGRLVAEGDLRRTCRGVYLTADLPDDLDSRAASLARVVAEHHVVVDRTAAWLHGTGAHAYAELWRTPPVETCALRGHQPTRLTAARGRTRDLAPRDVMVLAGLRVTTPLRTALDCGCHLKRREAMAVLNSLARTHGLTRADLRAELPRFRRRRGVVQLRELIQYLCPAVESDRESWVLLAIRDAGLPEPEPQFWIHRDGVPTYRLDFAYPHLRVCVEYDGAEAHDRSPRQRERDERRRQWLREHHWTVIVVREGDFTAERLDAWLEQVRDALVASYTTRRW
ncbi:type IV toxin-antitoxin system AbiEi family antitoxin domain-containing protein [Nocardioides panacisoli]|uniref:type IV toxin-antitoxin system AbiEi family antitoxin domain-containing protein n=1 Tax=Nocardioides panacisoli TaxID=627624 RepID=UPI001C62F426|nr:type IV toxin-antitoxin system AbiEi family antitoxin domain-containing protein [Nocardioides panacisoli]QYJ05020.1 type IV toxin-antitoxin system AbiEi family antitoxin domain-containing protein [Nocardioides panacisoli]